MELQSGFNVCPRCGKTTGDPVSYVTRTRLQSHLPTLGVLWIVAGALFLIPALILLFISGAAEFLIHANPVARALGPLVLTLIGGSILLVAVGGILVGWGLRNREPWARTTAIVLGILAILHPPFGTALGIYTLWVLLSDDGGTEYRKLASAT
jgi:hypothetical protein